MARLLPLILRGIANHALRRTLRTLTGRAAIPVAAPAAEVPAEAAVMVLNQMVEVVLLLQRQDLVLVFVKEEDQLLLLVETAVLQIEDKAVEVAEETKDLILEVAQVL